MGTEVHYKNSFPGYHSMRNANEDSNSTSWHPFYGNNGLTNGHYYDAFTPRIVTDAYSGQDKDELKQKMLQHEAIFKNQVCELHRIYKRQRDMMEEVKRKDFHKYHISMETSSSSSHMPSQKPYEDGNKWQNLSFPLVNSTSARVSIFGADINNSPLSCSNGNGSKDCEVVEYRPLKVRKKLFDLERPAHEYVETKENYQTSEIMSYPPKENSFVPENGVKTFLDDGGKKDCYKSTASGQHFMRSNGLADLNEPVHAHESNFDFLGPSAKPTAFNHLPFEGKVNGGNTRSNMNYVSQCYETSKLQTPSNTMQHLHGKEVQHRGISSDHSHFNQTPLPYSTSNAYVFISTSETGYSWSHSGLSWAKSNDSLTRKLASFQTHPNFLSSPRSHEVFRDKWHRNANGFHNGSSSGSKEISAWLTSAGFDYRNCIKIDDSTQKIHKGSNFVDLTGTTKGMDLNTVQTLFDEDDNSITQTELPWLKAKAVMCKTGEDLGDVLKEKDDYLASNKKLSGIPIFGKFCVSKNDASFGVLTSASVEHKGIDINVAWDDVSASEQIDVKPCDTKREETDAENKNFKNQFNLNSCVTEDDDLFVPERVKSSKVPMEIDLEAPAVSEIEEEYEHKETEPEAKPDNSESKELAKIAAVAIVAISSQQDHVRPVSDTAKENDYNNDPLIWFVEVINSCDKKTVSPTHEPDEYEMLILELEDTKEEDYMPTPLVPEIQEPDEVDPALTSRPRRGQVRRVTPRRHFQRDILPGVTSLSRHEITEDVHIFGGLMRATGHSWNLGLPKRNVKRIGARGRRKVKALEITPAAIPPPPLPTPAKQVNIVEVVGLEERSLTGWGKTTRRPRRQRCAAGNTTVAVQLT